jgi:O-antigen/teichoic acid export membrane protein
MPAFLFGFSLIFMALIPISRGILQGLQNFKALGINMALEGFLKLALAAILIFAGFKANGAIAAVSLALGATFAFSLFPLKLSKKKKSFATKKIYTYSWPVLLALLSITALYTVDLLLVKHFFSAEQTGHYAALSLLGKIVFFGATSIGFVMFPKVAELQIRQLKKDSKKIFKKSLLFTLLIASLTVIAYFLFSDLLIGTIFGTAYLDISKLLGLFGLAMALLSLSYIAVLNKLALGKKKFIWALLAAVVAEIALISLFHGSLQQIVNILIGLNALLLALLLIEK